MQRKSGKELLADWKKSAKQGFFSVDTSIKLFMKQAFLKRLAIFEFKNDLSINENYFNSSPGKRDFDIFLNIVSDDFLTPIHYIRAIISEKIDDGVNFLITDANLLNSESDYKIVRIWLKCYYDNIISTLIFDCFINLTLKIKSVAGSDYLLANIEFPLAEKLERIIFNGVNNKQINDFYYIYYVTKIFQSRINFTLVKIAFEQVSEKNHTNFINSNQAHIFKKIEENESIFKQWLAFQSQHKFAQTVSWHEIIKSLKQLYFYCFLNYKELNKINFY